ncbi:diacylglycerol lipase-beta [Rana temporaria]|uniref:diacylglycerol lipase-beta n=1 Tax=Rana temporaria TaxID=8407 RepID=UPI001AACE059|nr:diacylglycerol lipase-beta [Rana temporaria]
MPGLMMFGRRWVIASDDLVFPGAFELLVRFIWWIGILVLYSVHKGNFDCIGGPVLRSYLIVLIVMLAAIICSVSSIVYVSMQGKQFDTDLVPSDIAAGLALLHQEQDKVELSRDPDEVLCQSPTHSAREDLDVELDKAAHYMQFAAAAYGWPLYVYSRPFTGLCKLCGECCQNRSAQHDIVGGDDLNCHFGSILQTTKLQYRDFIHISFHNRIYEIPFFVALDHKTEAILVAVRGTLSLESAECENLQTEGVEGDCFSHKGICQAASYIYRRLINDGILNQAFTIAPEYKLVIVGHSLGAGAASILAIMLRSSFPTLKCYAFSPPGGLLSKALAEYSQSFIISIILGKDFVPRLSLPNMEDLKNRILRMVVNCNRPKYQILLRGCWYELFGGDPDNFPTELDGRNLASLSQPLLAEQSFLVQKSSSYNTLTDGSPLDSPRHPLLYLPGKIIHITEESRSGWLCFSDVKYSARWSKETSFSSIYISPRMITDHMPDIVLNALNSLCQERVGCTSCHTPQQTVHNNRI